MNISQLACLSACVLGFMTLPAHSQSYWLDGAGSPVRSMGGDCVRTAAWSALDTHPICNPPPPPPAPPKVDRVVLLPAADGTVGRVIISSAKGQQELSNAFGAVSIATDGSLKNFQESAESVSQKYGAVLSALPNKPQSYILYFKSGASELTADSSISYEQMKSDALQRVMPEILVIGHTDTTGSSAANNSLSLKRAQAISKRLSAEGVKAVEIQATGRGESDLLVPTKDNVAEAANRRVQIEIR